MPVQCICPICGKPYLAKPYHLRTGKMKYCSTTCGGIARRKRIQCACKVCGKTFERCVGAVTRSKKGPYCSRECSYVAGETHPTWRGGRWVAGEDGYVMLASGSGKRVFEHRHIMEQHLGRPLEQHEVVHHINGIVDDNRIENLEVMSRSDHVRLHWEIRRQHSS